MQKELKTSTISFNQNIRTIIQYTWNVLSITKELEKKNLLKRTLKNTMNT